MKKRGFLLVLIISLFAIQDGWARPSWNGWVNISDILTDTCTCRVKKETSFRINIIINKLIEYEERHYDSSGRLIEITTYHSLKRGPKLSVQIYYQDESKYPSSWISKLDWDDTYDTTIVSHVGDSLIFAENTYHQSIDTNKYLTVFEMKNDQVIGIRYYENSKQYYHRKFTTIESPGISYTYYTYAHDSNEHKLLGTTVFDSTLLISSYYIHNSEDGVELNTLYGSTNYDSTLKPIKRTYYFEENDPFKEPSIVVNLFYADSDSRNRLIKKECRHHLKRRKDYDTIYKYE